MSIWIINIKKANDKNHFFFYNTPENIKDEEPNATVTEGLSIRDDDVESSQSEVDEWLYEIGF